MIYLEVLRDKCIHHTRSKAWKWSNPGFPIPSSNQDELSEKKKRIKYIDEE